jgi:DNA polymerase/3'-5' exonuclease PolX
MSTAETTQPNLQELAGRVIESLDEQAQEQLGGHDEEASEYTKIEQAHYQEIRDTNKSVRSLELEHDAAKSKASAAKKAFEQADAELRHLIARGPDRQGQLDLDAGQDSEAWRTVTLAEIGVDASILKNLMEHDPPIATIGDVQKHCEEYELTNVKGIGAAAELKIDQALSQYWQDHPRQDLPPEAADETAEEATGEEESDDKN